MQIGNCTFHNVYLDKPEAAKDLPLPSVLKWRVSQLMIQSRMRGEFGFQLAKAEVDPDFAARVKHLCVKGTKNKIWIPQVYKDVGSDKEPVLHKQVEVLLSTRWLEMINDEIENKGIDGLFKEFVIDVNFRNAQADEAAKKPPKPEPAGTTKRPRSSSDTETPVFDTMRVKPNAKFEKQDWSKFFEDPKTEEPKKEEPKAEKKPKAEEPKKEEPKQEESSSWSFFTPFQWVGTALYWIFYPAFWLFGY